MRHIADANLLLPLLTNVRVMGSGILRPEQAWDTVGKLLNDPRIALVDQVPQTHAKHWRIPMKMTGDSD